MKNGVQTGNSFGTPFLFLYQGFSKINVGCQLNDGSKVYLVIIKDGYVYYGYTTLYFKIDGEVFTKVWNALESHRDSQ
jgi:hypothetical protein